VIAHVPEELVEVGLAMAVTFWLTCVKVTVTSADVAPE
jgi:ABC-type phosphate transport system permease subunit